LAIFAVKSRASKQDEGKSLNIDTLIDARWVIPVNPDGVVLEYHSVAIHEGRILEIIPTGQADKYQAASRHSLESHAVIPGLINAHTHASMNLLRGLADDLPLMTWLNDHIWPAEQKWVSEEFVADGTRLAVAEMLRGGVTCFNDMYFYPDITARVCADAGMRAVVGMIMIDFPSAWAGNSDEYLHRGLEVHDRYRAHPLITTAFAPHAPYSVSDAPLESIRTLADELGVQIHIHLHETRDEIRQSLSHYGVRPIQRLQGLGLLSPSLIAVHMTQLEDNELELFAASGAHVVHCPESNLKLASGFCPAARLLDSGINVAIGTDSAASNNDLDMFSEMRSTAMLAKGVAGDASALPAATALRMATYNGALALGIAGDTGSLESGKYADITAVDLGSLESQPIYHPISQLVYASSRNMVSDVWVGGRQALKSGKMTTLDENKLLAAASHWQEKVREQS
jgi:5-methylthioadenosine/S-adenosylhomocysteine deaminase